MLVEVLSDLEGRFIPIHEWHVAVHKNQLVVATVELIALHISDDLVESLEPIKRFVTNHAGIDAYAILKND